jgi:heme exporter protein CcmD
MMSFLAMGGYALYVWPAFLLVTAVLGIQAGHAVYYHRKIMNTRIGSRHRAD